MTTLIPVNLKTAFDTFVSFVDAEQNTHPNILADIRDEKIEKLDQYFDTLMEAAQKGLEAQLPPLLNALLQDWAIKEAVEYILRYQHYVIDAYDPGFQQDFWEKLGRQHQALSSKLLLELHSGNERRGRDWHTLAKQSVEENDRLRQEGFGREQRLYTGYQQANHQLFDQYHQAEQRWAGVALNGVKQQLDFAAQVNASTLNMMGATYQAQSQNLPDAADKREQKKARSKLLKILIILAIICVAVWVMGIVSHAVLMGTLNSFAHH